MNMQSLLIVFSGLSIMSYYDIKFRRIPNKISLIFMVIGSLSFLLKSLFSMLSTYETVFIIATALLLLIFTYVRIIGGGDLKALLFVLLTIPFKIYILTLIVTFLIVSLLVEINIEKPPLVPIYQVALILVWLLIG